MVSIKTNILISFFAWFLLIYPVVAGSFKDERCTTEGTSPRLAYVTLLSGNGNGFLSGALALGQSIIDQEINAEQNKTKSCNQNHKIHRIALVTRDVEKSTLTNLKSIWEVRYVEPIVCNNINANSPIFSADKTNTWSITCTKFIAWTLVEYDRIIFMDSDLLVLENIEDAFYEYSHAALLAAPEVFPPDNFNSGFMVITPSLQIYSELLDLNTRLGSTDGGDQSILNRGLCPNWYFADMDDISCGRLPSRFNFNAATIASYQQFQLKSNGSAPKVAHFLGDIKPWTYLSLEYQVNDIEAVPKAVRDKLSSQLEVQLLWRKAYFRAAKLVPIEFRLLNSLLQKHQETLRNFEAQKLLEHRQQELIKTKANAKERKPQPDKPNRVVTNW